MQGTCRKDESVPAKGTAPGFLEEQLELPGRMNGSGPDAERSSGLHIPVQGNTTDVPGSVLNVLLYQKLVLKHNLKGLLGSRLFS